MVKLYALEDNTTEDSNKLLIDKILEANKENKSALSLTADIIKQRQQLKEEILNNITSTSKEDTTSKKSLDKNKEDTTEEVDKEEDITDKGNKEKDTTDNKEEDTIDKGNKEEDTADNKEEDTANNKKEDTTDKKNKEEDTAVNKKEDTADKKDKEENTTKEVDKEEDTTDKKSTNKNIEDTKENTSSKETEEDISAAANDKESLKGLIGSGLKKESKENKNKKLTTTTESLSIKPKLTLTNIFNPIRNSYNKYRMSLESFNIPYKLTIEEQPIVYVKDSVKKSLDNLVQLSNNYIINNTSFINNISQTVKSLNERLTIFTEYVEKEKFHFTQKLFNDKDILSSLSIPNNSDIRATIKVLLSYIDNSTKVVSLILNNTFDKLKDSYTTNNFEEVEDDLSYKSTLPGFNLIKVHIDPYSNYLNTNIQNYQYYKLKVFKTEDIFSLSAITINSDNDIKYILTTANKLIGYISLIVDNLTLINSNFNKFIDEIKVIVYDIDQNKESTTDNKYKSLADIGIDDKVKDFIKFKLIIEECIIDVNIIVEYLTNLETIINGCIELKD